MSGYGAPRPLTAHAAISERVLEKMHLSDEWRREFCILVATALYATIHTDCEPGCVCEPQRSGVHTTQRNVA